MAKRVVVGRTTTPKMKMKQGPAAGASRGELAKRKEVRAKIGKKLPDEKKIPVFKLRNDTTLGKERVEKLSRPRTVKAPSQGPEFSRTGTRPPQYVAKQQNSDDTEQASSIARREGGDPIPGVGDDASFARDIPGGKNHPMFNRSIDGRGARKAHADYYKNATKHLREQDRPSFGAPSVSKSHNPKVLERNAEHAAHTEHFIGLGVRKMHGARMEAVRLAQHTLIAKHGIPQGAQTICGTTGCTRTTEGKAHCDEGSCNIVTNTKAASPALNGLTRPRSA